MDEVDRRELDRLLDLAELEQLMQFAPDPGRDAVVVLEERQAGAEGLVLAADETRRVRARLMPDSEWIGE